MTIDEEFNRLEDDLRRLKIEYEVYFNGATPRPPRDTLYRVEIMIKRYSSDQSMLNFSQRFRFASLAQRYAVNSNLWRRKLQEKEEGRSLTRHKRLVEIPLPAISVSVILSDPDAETEKVNQLLEAMLEARRRAMQSSNSLNPSVFYQFIKDKTMQVRAILHCEKVRFVVSVEDNKVKFKATKAA